MNLRARAAVVLTPGHLQVFDKLLHGVREVLLDTFLWENGKTGYISPGGGGE